MLELSSLQKHLNQEKLLPLLQQIQQQADQLYSQKRWGDLPKWQASLDKLPEFDEVNAVLNADQVRLSTKQAVAHPQLRETLLELHPWRKGPFHIHGIHIDTEWRSDWKWDRLVEHISPLHGRTVLDIGCGSGYHLWRMKGAGAEFVVGIDPSDLFLSQFQAIKHFNQDDNVHLLPLGVEQLPELKAFDTVFSMGVLYHRRSPIDFLAQLKAQLRKGGELVLETLVVEGDVHTVLVPTDRYAKMRNVWFIPSTAALTLWLERVGFKNIRVVNEDVTSLDEQRRTEWMETESLADFLDPNDQTKTIEGYPAPLRAIIIAEA